jgi:actin-like protein 6A
MLAEPSFNTNELRERAVELLFEKFSSPALFLAKNAVLSSFAMGRQSSLVVDAGHDGTVGAPALPLSPTCHFPLPYSTSLVDDNM